MKSSTCTVLMFMAKPCSVCIQCAPEGAHDGVWDISLTGVNYMIPSDNVTKSMLSFGAHVVKSKANIWEHLGISVLSLWSTAWKAEHQHL